MNELDVSTIRKEKHSNRDNTLNSLLKSYLDDCINKEN